MMISQLPQSDSGRRASISRFAEAISAGAEVVRLDTTLKAAAFTGVGAYLTAGWPGLLSWPALTAASVVCLIVAASFAINDYRDAHGDRLSHPLRPIPSGRLTPRAVVLLSAALGLAGLALASTLGWTLAALACATVALSAAYSWRLKHTLLLGNATIALLDALLVPYGGLAVGVPSVAVWIVAVLTFLYILTQEILYDVEDCPGDSVAGFRTTATRLGPVAALRVVRCFALMFVAAATAVWVIGLVPNGYIYAALPCSILPVLGVVVLLTVQPTPANVLRSGRVMKLAWMSSLVPVLLIQ